MLKNIMKRSEGFTLVELLVVIVVIGVLAAIAIPVFLSQADKANLASAQADVTNIAKLVQADLAEDQSVTDVTAGTGYTSAGGFGSVAAAGSVDVTVVSSSDWCVESTVSGQTAHYDSATGLATGACA